VEDSDGTDRHHFNAIATAQDLNDTFLPAFQAGVTEGKASGIMCR
jgi:beta-glucosidase-like glycosyl hydrolase